MRLSRISKAANSPNPASKTRRLFKTAKDTYLFETEKEKREAAKDATGYEHPAKDGYK